MYTKIITSICIMLVACVSISVGYAVVDRKVRRRARTSLAIIGGMTAMAVLGVTSIYEITQLCRWVMRGSCDEAIMIAALAAICFTGMAFGAMIVWMVDAGANIRRWQNRRINAKTTTSRAFACHIATKRETPKFHINEEELARAISETWPRLEAADSVSR